MSSQCQCSKQQPFASTQVNSVGRFVEIEGVHNTQQKAVIA